MSISHLIVLTTSTVSWFARCTHQYAIVAHTQQLDCHWPTMVSLNRAVVCVPRLFTSEPYPHVTM